MKKLILILAFLCAPAFGQTVVTLSPYPQLQFFDQNGKPLAFGCVFTYISGTTTPLPTFNDFTGNVQNQNPVPLSASGSANIWLEAGQAYTIAVKSAGGTNCSLGSLMYSVDGIGGGITTLTTTVAYAATVNFNLASQNQLFLLTLIGDAASQPLTGAGIIPPGIVTWKITQDTFGGHAFSWPVNTTGGATVCQVANCATQQTFIWDGTQAQAVGPASYTTSNEFALMGLYDFGLTASLPVCTDANKLLTSTCTGLIPNASLANSSVTYNGQTVALGATGNVNSGAVAHTMTLNQGNGSAETGLALTDDQLPVGRTGADPSATSMCNGNLNYNTSTHAFSCSAGGSVVASVSTTSCALAPNGGGEWSCASTVSWGTTLANTTYKAICSLSCPGGAGSCAGLAGGYQANFFWTAKSATQLSYTINDDHSGSNGMTYNMDCVAIE